MEHLFPFILAATTVFYISRIWIPQTAWLTLQSYVCIARCTRMRSTKQDSKLQKAPSCWSSYFLGKIQPVFSIVKAI